MYYFSEKKYVRTYFNKKKYQFYYCGKFFLNIKVSIVLKVSLKSRYNLHTNKDCVRN